MLIRKILIILGIGLLAFPISAGEPKYKPIDAETIEAYRKLGATHGGFKTSPNSLTAFSPGKDAAENGLPGFSFNRSKDRKLTKLPAASVPFGLVLRGATDAEISALSELKNLAALALTDSQITDKGLKDLKNLNNLALLDLDGCKRVRDTALKDLKDLKNLATLVLDGTSVTNSGLQELKDFKSLTTLSFKTQFSSDAGVRYLTDLKNLKTLHLERSSGNTQGFTQAGMQELKKAMPMCKIYLE